MPFTLPTTLTAPDDAPAIRVLQRYFETGPTGEPSYTGSRFDSWDSLGTRAQDSNRFTADDVVALTFLSVDVPPLAAERLLVTESDRFNGLLEELGPDRDLVDEPGPLDDSWTGWILNRALRELPGIGPTKATKLFARKRPRLRPIWDSVVADVTDSHDNLWTPLHASLKERDGALHRRLAQLHAQAALPAEVSALRVFDILCWMEGKSRGLTVVSD